MFVDKNSTDCSLSSLRVYVVSTIRITKFLNFSIWAENLQFIRESYWTLEHSWNIFSISSISSLSYTVNLLRIIEKPKRSLPSRRIET